MATGTIALVSHAFGLPTTSGDFGSSDPRVSAYGSRIAFESDATDLAAGVIDDDDQEDVFLCEVGLGVTVLISHLPNQPTMAGNYSDEEVRMNVDGTLLAFESASTDLVDDDLSIEVDLFAYEYPLPPIGTAYCPAVVNSSGNAAEIGATGSIAVADNDVTLATTGMPPGEFGYYLTSQTQGLVVQPGGSSGNLCLGGTIGRYIQDVQNTGVTGSFELVIDLTSLPLTPPVAVLPGETWNAAPWCRDTPVFDTAHVSNGVSIPFQ